MGPWAVLRYVPIIGMARSPSRFAIVAVMGLSLLCAFAVQAWLDRRRSYARVTVGIFVCLLAVEMVPGARRLSQRPSQTSSTATVAVSGDEAGRL